MKNPTKKIIVILTAIVLTCGMFSCTEENITPQTESGQSQTNPAGF